MRLTWIKSYLWEYTNDNDGATAYSFEVVSINEEKIILKIEPYSFINDKNEQEIYPWSNQFECYVSWQKEPLILERNNDLVEIKTPKLKSTSL